MPVACGGAPLSSDNAQLASCEEFTANASLESGDGQWILQNHIQLPYNVSDFELIASGGYLFLLGGRSTSFSHFCTSQVWKRMYPSGKDGWRRVADIPYAPGGPCIDGAAQQPHNEVDPLVLLRNLCKKLASDNSYAITFTRT